MRKIFLLGLNIALALFTAGAQDTFSIVALDTLTGEIGSAGASCIDDNLLPGGAIIISDILPGRGAIHTQAWWLSANQQNAHARMEEGLSPQEIIDWLVANDAGNNPTRRQYGVVDMDENGHPRTAAFTGVNCYDYKNHITGPNYSIQGNILLGQEILDSMEARFLGTDGSLAEKLMAALQGANVPGADSRCAGEGVSSLSAFIRLAWPSDTNGTFYLDLNVPETPYGVEPIDSLQVLFDEWLGTVVGMDEHRAADGFVIYPNPAREYLVIESRQLAAGRQLSLTDKDIANITTLSVYNALGKETERMEVSEDQLQNFKMNLYGYPPGVYTLILNGTNRMVAKKFLIIH